MLIIFPLNKQIMSIQNFDNLFSTIFRHPMKRHANSKLSSNHLENGNVSFMDFGKLL